MPSQMQIDFTPGLLEQFPTWPDCVRASVYQCGRAFKAVAADLDMSVSELSRKLAGNPNDPVHFPLDRLPDLIRATSNTLPVQWLVLTFMNDPEAERARALRELAAMAPAFMKLATVAGIMPAPEPAKVRR